MAAESFGKLYTNNSYICYTSYIDLLYVFMI